MNVWKNQLWVLTTEQLVTMIAAMLIALTLSILLPRLRFKSDEPLPTYNRSWLAWAPLVSIPLSYFMTFLERTDTSYGLLAAIALVTGIASVAVCTDQTHHRVPNMLSAILLPTVIAALVVESALTGNWAALLWGFIGTFAVLIWFIIMGIAGMGMGDLKLVPLITFPIAYVSGSLTLSFIVAGWIVAGLYAVVLWMIGYRKRMNGKMPMVPPLALTGMLIPVIIGAGGAQIWS